MKVGVREGFAARWIEDGAERTTGTVAFYATRAVATGREYWTSSAWTATKTAFATGVAHDGTAFTTHLAVPNAWDGATVTVSAEHSDAALPVAVVASEYVALVDLDDVNANVAAAPTTGDVDFHGD